jgi:endogenous inhibitor of DNA gyrase (YacG/DUF329 family)
LIGLGAFALTDPPSASLPAASSPTDDELIAELRKQIKGKEKEPAEAVYKNIDTLKGVPAGALLAIMDYAYRGSLGVKCAYCHDPSDWASDAKSEKRIAREMSRMVHDINGKYLASIKGLKSEMPAVNCTTCHRGEEKPALDLPEPVAGH